MKYKLHYSQTVSEPYIDRYAVVGGWLYVYHRSTRESGCAMQFVPDPTVEIEE